jgi:hypothetical protein
MGAGGDTTLATIVTATGHHQDDCEAAHRNGGHEAFCKALLFHYCNTLRAANNNTRAPGLSVEL